MMAKKRILVVDDEESMRYFLERALGRAGFGVAAAESGEAALELCREQAFDLVLLDIRLPGRDGLEVLQELLDAQPGLRVVMMTGFGSVDGALTAMHRGAADFLTKPFRTADVEAKVREALSLPPRSPKGPVPRTTPPPSEEPGPRPLTAFLIEAAKHRGLKAEEAGSGDLDVRSATRIFETLYFSELLQRTGGNVSLAARIAGISRPSLHRKIQDLGIDVGAFRA